MTQQEFFDKYGSDAQEAMRKTGIPASVTLAQAALESAYSAYAFQNNFFGIKASKNWQGKTQLLRTTECLPSNDPEYLQKHGMPAFPEVISIEPSNREGWYIWHIRDYFRAYDTALEGFIDHANFFIVNTRYSLAIQDEKNAEKFAEDIAKAGYATAPNYGESLIALIKEFNLTKYDSLV
jgi:flagellum-specific peptidoglycan hydrolase FlgJ